ncbi:MAG: PIN domain-containing protein [Solirubrobacteraceae bacterium]
MSDRAFLDTNVLVYAVDETEPEKRAIARRLLGSIGDREFVLSTQILGEFYTVVTRKLDKPISETVAAAVVDQLSLLPTVHADPALVKAAIQTSRSAQLSYWDGLAVASAAFAGCKRLLTEDLNHGQVVGSVRVENPFRENVGSRT